MPAMKIEDVPFNDEPANNPDRDAIAGPYSTFDVGLSRLAARANQTGARSDKLAALRAANQRVPGDKAQALALYIRGRFDQALGDVLELGRMYENFDQLNWDQRIDFAQHLINEATARIHMVAKHELPKIRVISSRDFSLAGFRRVLGKFPEIVLNPDMMDRAMHQESGITAREYFLETLRHEYQHAIDHLVPRMSALGAQVVKIAQDQYKGVIIDAEKGTADMELYNLNPLEIMAYGQFKKFGGK